jgi:SAM-dependent methyltransferase
MYSATYSPDDNKLRLYASSRLDAETFARVKAAGFRWAPKQELFVAPMWTPEREDLLLDLCGEIDDEDTSLVERAEERAERFEEYSEARAVDAKRAADAVRQLADGIPLGQPILVGHHSQRRAEKDAERIENGMRRAVRMWETSSYWTSRAAGALHHAKYKELPQVRARRIKGIESDRRKVLRNIEDAERALSLWTRDGLTQEEAVRLAGCVPAARFYLARKEGDRKDFDQRPSAYDALSNSYPNLYAPRTLEEVVEAARRVFPRTIEHNRRWLAHYDNRLAYERAMLDEQGGTVADQVRPEKGGAVRCLWGPRGGWAYIQKVNKVSVTVLHQWSSGGRTFRHNEPFDKLSAVMTRAEVEAAREAGRLVESENGIGFFLSSDPVKVAKRQEEKAEATPFEAMRDALKVGVQVVSAPQLFPTPAEIARQVVELAGIDPGDRILEPSAGTGALLEAAIRRGFGFDCGVRVVAVEVNHQLADGLCERRRKWLCATPENFDVRCSDFLTCTPGDLGTFDRIVMNPPFENGADIRHIEHARGFLKPGGRLVAICANGPRQRDRLQPLAAEWIDLPAGSFKSSGTMVNAAVLAIDAES